MTWLMWLNFACVPGLYGVKLRRYMLTRTCSKMRGGLTRQVIPAAFSASRASVSSTAALLPGNTILDRDEQGSWLASRLPHSGVPVSDLQITWLATVSGRCISKRALQCDDLGKKSTNPSWSTTVCSSCGKCEEARIWFANNCRSY